MGENIELIKTIKKDKLISILDNLIRCPITTCIMHTPTVASDGYIYEKSVIRRILIETTRSPMINKQLKNNIINIPLIDKITSEVLKIVPELKADYLIENVKFSENKEYIIELLYKKNFTELKNFKEFELETKDKYNNIFIVQLLNICKDEDVLFYIINNSVNFKGIASKYLSYFAFYCQSISIFRYLKDIGVNFNIVDTNNRNPLYYSIQRAPVDIIKFLVECGLDINNSNCLYNVINNPHIDTVMYVINNITDINTPDATGQYFIHKILSTNSVKKYLPEIITILIDKGVNINQPDVNNIRPIHLMFRYILIDVVKQLISTLTDFECETKDGWRPIHYASLYGSADLIDILLSKDVVLNTEVNYNAKKCLPINLLEYNINLEWGIKEMYIDFFIAKTLT